MPPESHRHPEPGCAQELGPPVSATGRILATLRYQRTMNARPAATGHPALTRLHQSLWITVVMSLLFMGLFVYYVLAEKAIDQANEERLESLGLAAELRQSSDDLTRMVRTYIATGNLVYQKYYMEILAIRDGHSPRPITAMSTGIWFWVMGPDPGPQVPPCRC